MSFIEKLFKQSDTLNSREVLESQENLMNTEVS